MTEATADVEYDYDDEELRLDFTGVSDVEKFELLPNGLYPFLITNAELNPAGENAKYPGEPVLSLEFTVIDGHEYEHRKVWDRMAVGPSSRKTINKRTGVEEDSYSVKKLKGLLGAVGYDATGDLRFRVADLMDQVIDGDVGREAGNKDYGPKNRINGYYPHETTEAERLS